MCPNDFSCSIKVLSFFGDHDSFLDLLSAYKAVIEKADQLSTLDKAEIKESIALWERREKDEETGNYPPELKEAISEIKSKLL